MSTFIVCTGCHRHIRADEPQCPFCNHEVTAEDRASAGTRAPALPRKAGRAALWVLGAAAATTGACGGKTDGDSNDAGDDSRAAGGSAETGGAAGAPGAGALGSMGGSSMGGSKAGLGGAGGAQGQPVYGAPVDPPPPPTAQPLYGLPTDPPTDDDPPMGQPEYGAPQIPDDAGVADAGADAAPDAKDNPSGSGTPTPVYGAPFTPQE